MNQRVKVVVVRVNKWLRNDLFPFLHLAKFRHMIPWLNIVATELGTISCHCFANSGAFAAKNQIRYMKSMENVIHGNLYRYASP
jgi:hypothetical protein